MTSGPDLAPSAFPAPAPPSTAAPDPPAPARDRLHEYANRPPLQVLRGLESSLRGLDEDEAQARLDRHGDNVVIPAGIHGWPRRLGRAAVNPFVLVLALLDVVSLATADLPGAAVITTMAVISCGLQMGQEHRADHAAAALRAMVSNTSTVIRQASPGVPPIAREVPTDQLVAGDIVRLTAGDIVPADIRLLRANDLMVNQALLTGESQPVRKHASLNTRSPAEESPQIPGSDATLFDSPRLCLLGSTVVAGTGTGVVVATGTGTYLGATSQNPPRRHGETTFDRGVRNVSWTLIRVILVAIPAVMILAGLAGGDWLQAFLLAVSVAVALTPQMLPVVVNTSLARGAALMRRSGIIVKRLPAIHNLGAMDVLCTDKTGTLTSDRVSVAHYLDPAGRPAPQVLQWAALTGYVCAEQLGLPVGDPVDEALLRRAEELGLPVEDQFVGLDSLGFDPVRRRATAAIRRQGQLGVDTLVTNGAVEEILDCCTRVRTDDADVPLTATRRHQIGELADSLHRDGQRVLAVAVKDRPARGRPLRPADEHAMTLVGVLGLVDEPKETLPAALAALRDQGVRVVVVTGDHPLSAARICQDAGMPPARPVTGGEVDLLDDATLTELAARTTVFARVDPRQKARVVAALRAGGHTVGYLGDGVNDAAALRVADVGISVDTAVGIARESSDVLLARKELAALPAALGTARRTYTNIIKYLKITISSNIGNVCSVLAASVLLPFLPMLPLQILVQNLLFDTSQLSLAADRGNPSEQRRPRTFDTPDLIRFVACFGLINTLADLATFAALWHTLGGQPNATTQLLFHTGWFVENLLTQALAVHLLRDRGGPTRWSWAARPVLAATAGIGIAALALPFTLPGHLLGLQPLPGRYYGWLAAVLTLFGVATLIAKNRYQRIFRTWL